MILDNPFSYVLAYFAAWALLIIMALIAVRALRVKESDGWFYRILSNSIAVTISVIAAFLLAEGYFGFIYDKTDSYGYLLTSVRWFKRHYKYNNVGLRDDKDYYYKKGKGKHRIVFIGDSFTAGHGIKNIKDRFTGIIEDRLKREPSRSNYEVYTIAINGWETNDQVDYLVKLLEDGFEADEIVLCFNMNDVGWASPKKSETFKILNERVPRNWLLQHSFFLNFLYVRIGMFSMQEYQNYFDWLSDSYTGKTWQLERMLLWKFKDVCLKRGCTLKVVIFPLIGDLSGGFKMRVAHDKVASFFIEEGIPYIDMSKQLSEFPAKKLTVNKFDAHPNEFAHKIIAEEIWKLL